MTTQNQLILDTSFRGTIISPGVVLKGTYVNCSFYLAAINGVLITGARFYSCNFITATIRHSEIKDTTFSNCSFAGASIKQSDFSNNIFRACDFTGTSLLKLRGTSTCRFEQSCDSLETATTDLIVKEMPGKDHYLVCPAAMVETLEREIDMPPMINGVGAASLQRKTPRRDWAKGRPALPPANLIDPVALPDVDHYRSSAQKIPRDKKPSDYQAHYAYDEEDYGCHYMMGGYGGKQQHHGTYTVTRNAEYKFGYMSNGVLECSDIEEYTECPG